MVKNASLLQRLQNAAFRGPLRCDKRSSIQQMHDLLEMPILSTRRFNHTAIEMYKVYHLLSPCIISDRLNCVEHVSTVSTRSAVGGDFYIHCTPLQQTKHSFCFRGVMVWKSLPLEARFARSAILIDGVHLNVLRSYVSSMCHLTGMNKSYINL